MPKVEINGLNFPVDSGFANWGELLSDLETHRIKKGNAIASVYFDGIEEPGFREPLALAREMASIGEIQIQLTDMDTLIKEALVDCERFMRELQTNIVATAEDFRMQRIDQANQALSSTFQAIKMLISLMKGLELSLGHGADASLVDPLVSELGPALEGLIGAQSDQDWILVADMLEFELSASAGNFEPVLLKFKQKMGLA